MIKGHRIELLAEMQHLYEDAIAGSRGWAKDVKTDHLGFPLVFVEWDRDHWKYTGQEDGWTFQSHFRITGYKELDEVTKEIEREDYLDTIMHAADVAADSDGFLILTLKIDGGRPVFESNIGANSLTAWTFLQTMVNELGDV